MSASVLCIEWPNSAHHHWPNKHLNEKSTQKMLFRFFLPVIPQHCRSTHVRLWDIFQFDFHQYYNNINGIIHPLNVCLFRRYSHKMTRGEKKIHIGFVIGNSLIKKRERKSRKEIPHLIFKLRQTSIDFYRNENICFRCWTLVSLSLFSIVRYVMMLGDEECHFDVVLTFNIQFTKNTCSLRFLYISFFRLLRSNSFLSSLGLFNIYGIFIFIYLWSCFTL